MNKQTNKLETLPPALNTLDILPSKASSFFPSRACRRSAVGSTLFNPPVRLDFRRTSTLKMPISSVRAIPLAVLCALAVSQQWAETVVSPSLPSVTLIAKNKPKKQQKMLLSVLIYFSSKRTNCTNTYFWRFARCHSFTFTLRDFGRIIWETLRHLP